MANLDLMSYERDSRWMPHLSWAYPDLTLQQRMEQQAAQRQQAWQKIADKLGPLLIGSDIGGSYGQSDYISRDICEDQEYLERAYEKAPLLSSAKYPCNTIRSQKQQFNSNTKSSNYNNLLSQQADQQQQQRIANHQTRNNNNNTNRSNQQQQQHSGQKHNNLNLYAQQHQHHIQMPQRGQNHIKQNASYHNSGSQLFILLSVLLFMLLLLLFSLLLFFFYFNN